MHKRFLFLVTLQLGLIGFCPTQAMTLGDFYKKPIQFLQKTWQTTPGKMGILAAAYFVPLTVYFGYDWYQRKQQSLQWEKNLARFKAQTEEGQRESLMAIGSLSNKEFVRLVCTDDVQGAKKLMNSFAKADPVFAHDQDLYRTQTELDKTIESFTEKLFLSAARNGAVKTIDFLVGQLDESSEESSRYAHIRDSLRHRSTITRKYNQVTYKKALCLANANGQARVVKRLLGNCWFTIDFAPEELIEESIQLNACELLDCWLDWIKAHEFGGSKYQSYCLDFKSKHIDGFVDLACKMGAFDCVIKLSRFCKNHLVGFVTGNLLILEKGLKAAVVHKNALWAKKIKEEIIATGFDQLVYIDSLRRSVLDAIEHGHDDVAIALLDASIVQRDAIRLIDKQYLMEHALNHKRWKVVESLAAMTRPKLLIRDIWGQEGYHPSIHSLYGAAPCNELFDVIIAYRKDYPTFPWNEFFSRQKRDFHFSRCVDWDFEKCQALVEKGKNACGSIVNDHNFSHLLLAHCKLEDKPQLTKYLMEQGWDITTYGSDHSRNELYQQAYDNMANKRNDDKVSQELVNHHAIVSQELEKTRKDSKNCFGCSDSEPHLRMNDNVMTDIAQYCSLSPSDGLLPDEVENGIKKINEIDAMEHELRYATEKVAKEVDEKTKEELSNKVNTLKETKAKEETKIQETLERYLWNGGSLRMLFARINSTDDEAAKSIQKQFIFNMLKSEFTGKIIRTANQAIDPEFAQLLNLRMALLDVKAALDQHGAGLSQLEYHRRLMEKVLILIPLLSAQQAKELDETGFTQSFSSADLEYYDKAALLVKPINEWLVAAEKSV